jgi:hypothetical protein
VGRFKKYSIKYLVGKTVSAKKGTLGIFCFDTFLDAYNFKSCLKLCYVTDFMILEVNTIGAEKKFKKIASSGSSRDITYFYKKIKNKHDMIDKMSSHCFIPKETVCYPKVKVLT